jgi:uncharacterized membrane protein
MEIKLFLIVLISILIIDGIWIGLIAKNFYKTEMKNIARFKDGGFNVRWVPVAILYILMTLGIIYFVNPHSGVEISNLFRGAFLGLIMYGVYDLTNYSLLKDFSLKLAAVDIVWGAFLVGVVSFIAGILR